MPTVNESQSVKGVVVEIWAALTGPPQLPLATVERIGKAVQAILADKDFTEHRAKMGDMAVPFMPPAEFGRYLIGEGERYRGLATGLKLE